jgi:hypothetical protein
MRPRWVGDRRLGETADEKQGDDGADRVAKGSQGSGKTDGEAAAGEEAGSDAPPMAIIESWAAARPMETFFTIFNCFEGFAVDLKHQNHLKVAHWQIDCGSNVREAQYARETRDPRTFLAGATGELFRESHDPGVYFEFPSPAIHPADS